MAINVAGYNRQFLEKVTSKEPVFNNTKDKYGVTIKKLGDVSVPLKAEKYWRVVGIHHLTGAENMGNHHVYCDVLDEDGKRINQAKLKLIQGSASPVFAVVDKPANEAGMNFPMWSKTRATVSVAWPADNPLPSEEVTGLRTDHADEEVGNTWGHHSFYIVFQRTAIPSSVGEMSAAASTTTTAEQPTDISPEEAESSTTESVPLSLEETIALTGQALIIPLNVDAMFYKIAKENQLGERLSSEYDAQYKGKSYRAQIYEKGVVYAEVGDWGNVKIIPRSN